MGLMEPGGAHAKIKNLQVFHLLDTILTVCYIRRVFRCNRHGSGMLDIVEQGIPNHALT